MTTKAAKKKKKKTAPSEPLIYCVFDKLVSIVKLNPHPKNPNQHPENQVEALAEVIKANGWRSPITISKRSGFIVAGHGRLLAAKKLGLKRVPVDIQDFDDELDELSHLLADNKISDMAEMNFKGVGMILADFPKLELARTGFSEHEVKPILDQIKDPPSEEPPAEPSGEVVKMVYFKATEPQGAKIREAIDRVKVEKPDMSDGRALELIAADFLS